MKRIIIIFVFILSSFCSTAQKDSISAVFVDSLSFDRAVFRGVDKYQNLYFSKNNVFFKSSEAEQTRFFDPQLGSLTSVDLINPLRITLFYRDVNTVVILDDRLNEITRVNFNRLENFKTVGYANTSSNESLWIFNIDQQSLERYDYVRKQELSASPPISEEIFQQNSNFNFCWLLGEKQLMRYNSYGSLTQAYPAQKILYFSEDHERVLIKKENSYALKLKNKEVFTPVKGIKNHAGEFYLSNENLYLYDGEKVFHYQLKLPN